MMLSESITRPHIGGGVALSHLARLVFPTMPDSVHRAVMAAFPDGGDNARAEWRILHRLEPGSVLVQSGVPGNWASILPWSAYQQRTITHDPIEGQRYLFRMAINPVSTRNGRRIPITAEAWLERRNIGASLEIQDVSYTTHYDRSSSGHRVVTEVATVSGSLVVSDVPRFTDVLCNGLGRGRAYGCGLVSVVAET